MELNLRLHETSTAYQLRVENRASAEPFHLLAGPTEDPDQDGFTNLQEMAFGTEPLRATKQLFTVGQDGFHFDIPAATNNGPEPIAVTLETSDDLMLWDATSLAPGTYTLPIESDSKRLFHRFLVAQPQQ